MDRPRRATRAPIKAPHLLTAKVDDEPTRRASKRKAPSSSAGEKPVSAKAAVGPSKFAAKAKAPADPEAQLKTLLTSPKSDLVSLDLSDLINARTWAMLSDEARAELEALLPPTAFVGYGETLGADHPLLQPVEGEGEQQQQANGTSSSTNEMETDAPQEPSNGNLDVDLQNRRASPNDMDVDPPCPPQSQAQQATSSPPRASCKTLSPTFFTDPHLLAALRTFQDHLYLGWFTDAHTERVRKFEEAIRDGTLAAPWKDEVWEREHGMPVRDRESGEGGSGEEAKEEARGEESRAGKEVNGLANGTNGLAAASSKASFSIPCESNARAGGASEVKLPVLVKQGILRVGDVIAYRRSFASSSVIEKDCMIQSIDKKTFSLTVIAPPGRTRDMPAELLMPASLRSSSSNTPSSHLTLTVISPTQLETALLDTDARMDRARRPNGNAWKCFSVWRWRVPGVPFGAMDGAEEEEEGSAGEVAYNPDDARGGRENHGTLFYLRGSYYHDR